MTLNSGFLEYFTKSLVPLNRITANKLRVTEQPMVLNQSIRIIFTNCRIFLLVFSRASMWYRIMIWGGFSSIQFSIYISPIHKKRHLVTLLWHTVGLSPTLNQLISLLTEEMSYIWTSTLQQYWWKTSFEEGRNLGQTQLFIYTMKRPWEKLWYYFMAISPSWTHCTPQPHNHSQTPTQAVAPTTTDSHLNSEQRAELIELLYYLFI